MKICRITKYFPGGTHRSGVLHPYFYTKYIPEPTLIIAKQGFQKAYPLPSYATLKEISYHDVAFTSTLDLPSLQNRATRLRQKFRFMLRLTFKLREIVFALKSIPTLIRFRPDIVHSHGLITMLQGLFAKAFLGSHFVITIHNVTEAVLTKKLPPLRFLLKFPDKIICVSNAIKKELSHYISVEKLEVIPTAFDSRIFKNLNLTRKDQLIAVGHFKWQKGYHHMIEAMADVSSKFNQYRLVIIGDGPGREKIQGLIDRLNLTDRVHLLGVLPQEEIAKHLNESKLFVMSSLVEGLPKALLEATACGTPAVVTTACNAEGIIENVGTAVEPGDSQGFAKTITESLEDEERWKALSRNCLNVAKDYDWETISGKVWNLYRGL